VVATTDFVVVVEDVAFQFAQPVLELDVGETDLVVVLFQ
jgi:hypothetical protein